MQREYANIPRLDAQHADGRPVSAGKRKRLLALAESYIVELKKGTTKPITAEEREALLFWHETIILD